jgi:hypothetical protein
LTATPLTRLGLYRAGYQILSADGSPVKGFEQPLINIEFDHLPIDRAAESVYAPSGCGLPITADRRKPRRPGLP